MGPFRDSSPVSAPYVTVPRDQTDSISYRTMNIPSRNEPEDTNQLTQREHTADAQQRARIPRSPYHFTRYLFKEPVDYFFFCLVRRCYIYRPYCTHTYTVRIYRNRLEISGGRRTQSFVWVRRLLMLLTRLYFDSVHVRNCFRRFRRLEQRPPYWIPSSLGLCKDRGSFSRIIVTVCDGLK